MPFYVIELAASAACALVALAYPAYAWIAWPVGVAIAVSAVLLFVHEWAYSVTLLDILARLNEIERRLRLSSPKK